MTPSHETDNFVEQTKTSDLQDQKEFMYATTPPPVFLYETPSCRVDLKLSTNTSESAMFVFSHDSCVQISHVQTSISD